MKKLWAKLNKRNGFTLTEALVIVAIIIVLLALAIPGLRELILNLRQTELDAKAEQVYIAAQNTLSNLRAGGEYSRYAKGVNVISLNAVPLDADPETIFEDTLCH